MLKSIPFTVMAACLVFQVALSQNQFNLEQIIRSDIDGAALIRAADIDNDGDQDLLSAERSTTNVLWYENINGSFETVHLIASQLSIQLLNDIEVDDIDLDGDMDVFVAIGLDATIVFFENSGSAPYFAGSVLLSDSADGVADIQLADMDGNGFKDILFDNNYSSRLSIIKNQGANGLAPSTIFYDSQVRNFIVLDIDQDELNDLVVFNYSNVMLKALNQNGTLTTAQPFASFASNTSFVGAADMDGDGRKDLLTSDPALGNIDVLLQNENAGFEPAITICSSLTNPIHLATGDLDNDGDLDIIVSSDYDSAFDWLENLQGSFADPKLIGSVEPFSVMTLVIDADSDGDLDVIGSKRGGDDGQLLYYKNGLINGIAERNSNSLQTFPNPATDRVFITAKAILDLSTISIIDTRGRETPVDKERMSDGTVSLNLSYLPPGLYYLVVEAEEIRMQEKIVKL